MADPAPSFGDDHFEEEVVRIKELMIDDSKQLPPIDILILGFIKEHCRDISVLFRRSAFRKAFIKMKHLEDLVYVVVRA